MDKVKAMQTFVRIVEANSFTKAAETLDLPRAALTATLKNLEAFLGTQLLQRTTRRLSLTPDGAEYYRQCVDILAAIESAELALRGPEARRPRGKLRVDLPGALGRYLVVPRLAQFHQAYPEVELALSLTHRLVDLTQEGMDCVLRVGALQDSSMIGRQLGSMRFVTCAAPSYLERHGTPQTTEDLARHQCVVHFSGRTGRPFEWEWLEGEGASKTVRKSGISGPVAVNDADAYISCALQGLGLVQAATYQVREHLAAGRLVALLPQAVPTPMPISLLYPQGRMSTPKLSVFAAWLATLFEHDPELHP